LPPKPISPGKRITPRCRRYGKGRWVGGKSTSTSPDWPVNQRMHAVDADQQNMPDVAGEREIALRRRRRTGGKEERQRVCCLHETSIGLS
ncbi:MAG TPA: hypothetical protein VGS58_12735, partial [Candidatus Sulfopaludibacter sp.]|nr:hypothetical protein [Candidatus Sulfopaludibacter sp.]